jgi:hypothetical protein
MVNGMNGMPNYMINEALEIDAICLMSWEDLPAKKQIVQCSMTLLVIGAPQDI